MHALVILWKREKLPAVEESWGDEVVKGDILAK